jgi:hypothetical protein
MCKLTRREVAGLQTAERLETLTDGLVKVVYCPEALLAGQGAGSAGHMYYCYLEAEPTEFWLDDRDAKPLTVQMARRFRQLATRLQMARRFRQLATRLDQLAEQIEARPVAL